MSIYLCVDCDYKTNDKSNYLKHNLSQKHIKKEREKLKEKNNNNNPETADGEVDGVYLCSFCGINYSTSSSLSRHRRICSEKKILKSSKKMNY